MHACMHTEINIHMHARIQKSIYICMHAYRNQYTYACKHTEINTHMHVCMLKSIYKIISAAKH